MTRKALNWAIALAVLSTAADLRAQVLTVTLEEAIELALRAQPNVVRARGDLDVARATQREALGNWFPTLSANSGWSTNSATRFDPNTQRTVTAASTSYSAGLSASLELFDGFRRPALNRAASAGAESAEAALVNQEFQVILQTKQAFFNALSAAELVRVSETRIERAAQQLKIAKDKLAAGSATRSDTLRAMVELGNAQLQLLNAQAQLATAEANLGRMVGVDGPVRPVADSTLFRLGELDTAALREEARRNSPAVRLAEAQARAAAAQVVVSRAQYFPSITASYSQSFAGNSLDAMNNTWSARVSLSWPLFNGFSRELNLSRSVAAREAAEVQAADARRQVDAQLTQYLAALNAAQQQLVIAEASRAAAEEDLRVQQERYRLGAATILDVLTSQVNLDQAEVDLVQARLNLLLAKAQLEALIGREL
ncbi:MAG: outer membrane channel protein TolC [Gemmatimonadales bacterium]|nr:Antibiotic efflux pump outer membrane protein ArpC [bacterium HR33]GIW51961.1 MAG: outer membrane channel protein TolC [Gemmatimonadales bacterium]